MKCLQEKEAHDSEFLIEKNYRWMLTRLIVLLILQSIQISSQYVCTHETNNNVVCQLYFNNGVICLRGCSWLGGSVPGTVISFLVCYSVLFF